MNEKIGFALHDVSGCLPNQTSLFFEPITMSVSQTLTFIAGKNGVGKTTLLKLISGDSCSFELMKGRITVQDKIYNLMETEAINQLEQDSITVSQQTDLMLAKYCTGAENIAGARMQRFPLLSLFKTHPLPEIVHYFDIPLDIPVFRLSGGQRQMLSLLMAVQKPIKLLLLDEPTAALDEKNADLVMKFLQKLIDLYDVTVLCISHDESLIKRYGGKSFISIEENYGKREVKLKLF